MPFKTLEQLKEKFPNVVCVGGLEGLQEHKEYKTAVLISEDQASTRGYLVNTPEHELLEHILGKRVVVVKTSWSVIPYLANYTAFPIEIGDHHAGSKVFYHYTVLVTTERFNRIVHHRAASVVTSAAPPDSLLQKSTSMLIAYQPANVATINIAGIDKAEFLLELWLNANCSGPFYDASPHERAYGLFDTGSADITCDINIAKRMLEMGQTVFESLDLSTGENPRHSKGHSRYLGVAFTANDEIDPSDYDLHNGSGKMAHLVKELRKTMETRQRRATVHRKSRGYCLVM